MKILIVDDLREYNQFLSDILLPFAHCDIAINGADALGYVETAMIEKKPYDVILLDIMMPKMDGQVALQAIRAMEHEYGMVGAKEAVIIMVTALDSPFAAMEAFFRGYCTDYLTKPITRQVLLDKLREYHLIFP
ncbi:MAG: response regulator [Magnetococcus sp. YQC-5]